MRRVFDSRCTANPRRGSTFVVVLALLALLAIIGLAFVTFTGAEKESAEFFVATSNREVAPQINTDDTLDFGIRQLVLGASRDQYNSALWGGRHSLLAGMFGNNLSPHSGQGIHVGINSNTGSGCEPLSPHHGFERPKASQYVGFSAAVAHRANAPNLSL